LQVKGNILIFADSFAFSVPFLERTMSVIFPRLGHVLLSSATATSAILRFGFPVTIFTLFGFTRLTNVREAFSAAFIYSAAACLSWATGRAVRIFAN
jgi:hypothetical protein